MEFGRMSAADLAETAARLVADGKGLLAIDESIKTCNKRFAKVGVPQTEQARRDYRELLITTPGLSESISGVILYDETIRQHTAEGISFLELLSVSGIIPGIKVDTGTTRLAGHPGEKITEGLDGLRARLVEYERMGAQFAKWRAVLTIGKGRPTASCVEANAQALARYATLCQEAGLVPVVEPELLMTGDHTLQDCAKATERVLRTLFVQLQSQGVLLEGMILKPNMILPGSRSQQNVSPEEVADVTLRCLLRTVPAAVPAIAFLSGGQPAELASARLNAMNARDRRPPLPWAVSFSYGRAIQQPALHIWKGRPSHVGAAQGALAHRAACNAAARQGRYDATAEQTAA
ncbi:class I fructose-bisphosphate aldolase [Lacisediminihabitans sp. FW035]